VDHTATDSIRLTVPAMSAAVRIARAGATGLATRAGFTYHEVEQLRLAVAEAAALLVPQTHGRGTLAVTYDVEPEGMRIDMQLSDATAPASRPRAGVPDIVAAVLDANVDEWRLRDDGRRLVLRKRLSDVDEVD
jgi:serine/threonine-protein kinase RsbW